MPLSLNELLDNEDFKSLPENDKQELIAEHESQNYLTRVSEKVPELKPVLESEDFQNLDLGEKRQILTSLQSEIDLREQPKGAGVPKQEGFQPTSAFARGALENLTVGISGALAKRYGEREGDPSNPEFTNPYTHFSGEMLGLINPASLARGALVSGGKTLSGQVIKPTLGKTLKQGVTVGAGYGALGGAAEAIKDPNKGAEEILESAAEGVPVGVAAGTIPGVLPSAFRLGAKGVANVSELLSPTFKGTIKRILKFPNRFGAEAVETTINRSTEALYDSGELAPYKDLNEYYNSVRKALDNRGEVLGEALAKYGKPKINITPVINSIEKDIIEGNARLKNGKEAQELLPKVRSQIDLSDEKLKKLTSDLKAGKINNADYLKEIGNQKQQKAILTRRVNNLEEKYNQAKKDLDEIEGFSESVRGEFSLKDSHNYLMELNSLLETELNRRKLTTNNLIAYPDLNIKDKFRSALREKFNQELSDISGKDIKKIREQYGALLDVGEQLNKAIIVNERKAPLNLSRELSLIGGLAGATEALSEGETAKGIQRLVVGPFAGKASATLNDPNYLVNRAFTNLVAPKTITTKAKNLFREALQREAYPNDLLREFQLKREMQRLAELSASKPE